MSDLQCLYIVSIKTASEVYTVNLQGNVDYDAIKCYDGRTRKHCSKIANVRSESGTDAMDFVCFC